MFSISYKKILSEINGLSNDIVRLCAENGIKLATAESCTGGMVSAAITEVSGSSAVIELGVCSYSNRIKREVLGVSAETLDRFTEYSIQCAEEMAAGVKDLASADLGVSTTGVAGPSGGSEEHPVGEVCIGICCDTRSISERYIFPQEGGDGFSGRDYIRAAAARQALALLLKLITENILEGEENG